MENVYIILYFLKVARKPLFLHSMLNVKFEKFFYVHAERRLGIEARIFRLIWCIFNNNCILRSLNYWIGCILYIKVANALFKKFLIFCSKVNILTHRFFIAEITPHAWHSKSKKKEEKEENQCVILFSFPFLFLFHVSFLIINNNFSNT